VSRVSHARRASTYEPRGPALAATGDGTASNKKVSRKGELEITATSQILKIARGMNIERKHYKGIEKLLLEAGAVD
jgi:hypothetical protein